MRDRNDVNTVLIYEILKKISKMASTFYAIGTQIKQLNNDMYKLCIGNNIHIIIKK